MRTKTKRRCQWVCRRVLLDAYSHQPSFSDTILSGMRTPSSPTPMSRLAISTPMLTEPRTHGLEFLHPRVVEPTAVEKLEAPAMVVT